MKKKMLCAGILLVMLTVLSCYVPQERYNTQKGAAMGAGVGAVMGQAIGRNTEGTLIGAGIGTLVGAILGDAVDQNYQSQAARESAITNKRVIYYDDKGSAVEAYPQSPSQQAYPQTANQQTNCRKITKRVWDHGKLISETVEEICEGNRGSRDY